MASLLRAHTESDSSEYKKNEIATYRAQKREATSSATWGDGMNGPGRGSRSRDLDFENIETNPVGDYTGQAHIPNQAKKSPNITYTENKTRSSTRESLRERTQ